MTSKSQTFLECFTSGMTGLVWGTGVTWLLGTITGIDIIDEMPGLYAVIAGSFAAWARDGMRGMFR